jgi:hypothetical protein
MAAEPLQAVPKLLSGFGRLDNALVLKSLKERPLPHPQRPRQSDLALKCRANR